MDSQRFDQLTRALAFAANRRTSLKAVASLVLAGSLSSRTSSSRAQSLAAVGEPCSGFGANSECSQAGTPTGGIAVICSDNGVAADGQFTCCRNAGGVCGADAHCCGSALCIGGVCGGGGQSSGVALGAECTATSQCSQSGGSVVCADNGSPGDGARNCCRNSGGACTSDSHCCASLYCTNGVCAGSTSPGAGSGTLAPGAACSSTSQCSQSTGTAVCADNGISTNGALNCCKNEGGTCTDAIYSADCCGGLHCRDGRCKPLTSDGLRAPGVACSVDVECSQIGGPAVCADNGLPGDGVKNCCRFEGGACDWDAGCCAGLMCINGVCGGGALTGGTLPLGAACAITGECSQAGGPVYCDDNGYAYDGASNCCRYAGGACDSSAGCCTGLDCIGGVCGGSTTSAGWVSLGGQCASDSECSQVGGPVACDDNGFPGDGGWNCCRYTDGACFDDSGCCAGLVCLGGVCRR